MRCNAHDRKISCDIYSRAQLPVVVGDVRLSSAASYHSSQDRFVPHPCLSQTPTRRRCLSQTPTRRRCLSPCYPGTTSDIANKQGQTRGDNDDMGASEGQGMWYWHPSADVRARKIGNNNLLDHMLQRPRRSTIVNNLPYVMQIGDGGTINTVQFCVHPTSKE